MSPCRRLHRSSHSRAPRPLAILQTHTPMVCTNLKPTLKHPHAVYFILFFLAIKTSSSAVLTRSNSTGHRYHVNHHYIPVSPSKNSDGIKHNRYAPSHKHTRSLPFSTDDPATSPPPMPIPPSSTLPARLANQGYTTKSDLRIVSEGESIPPTPPLTLRVKRSDTLPSVFPNKTDTEISMQDLPVGLLLSCDNSI